MNIFASQLWIFTYDYPTEKETIKDLYDNSREALSRSKTKI